MTQIKREPFNARDFSSRKLIELVLDDRASDRLTLDQEALDELRTSLEDWMQETGDPVLAAFLRRDDHDFLVEFVAAQLKAANRRKQESRERWQKAMMESMQDKSAKKARDKEG